MGQGSTWDVKFKEALILKGMGIKVLKCVFKLLSDTRNLF